MVVRSHRARLTRDIENAVFRGVVRTTEHVRTTALDLILNTAKTGHEYRYRGVTHQASAPGEPFASDTGTAVGLIKTAREKATLSGFVNFGAAYSAELEFGTETMEARPVARPAAAEGEKVITGFIREEVQAALKKRAE